MPINSNVASTLDHGLVLNVTMDDLTFTAYVVISEPDINYVAELVSPDDYSSHGDVHVAAITSPDGMAEQINDIAFNMQPGDLAVLMCNNEASYMATLEHLGQSQPSGRPN